MTYYILFQSTQDYKGEVLDRAEMDSEEAKERNDILRENGSDARWIKEEIDIDND